MMKTESGEMEKDASGEMEETAEKAEESPSGVSQVPEQPQEVVRSAERQVEIATQPEPKPSTAPDIFPTPAPESTKPNLEEFAQKSPSTKKMVEITTNNNPLRVRNSPSIKSKILATVAKGSQVPFIEEKDGWYNVEFSKGQMGWISKKYSRLIK